MTLIKNMWLYSSTNGDIALSSSYATRVSPVWERVEVKYRHS